MRSWRPIAPASFIASDPVAATVARALVECLAPGELEGIRAAVSALMQHRSTIDMHEILRAAAITAARAALVLSCDLGSACRVVLGARPGTVHERLGRELLSFWIGEAHGRIRSVLGIAVADAA